ncbi:hypothetical protein AB6809_33270 [Paraburkholderia sp. RCC_158]|uniref:hypothetical protein n=1 Tax=Paraburkholderia sp. RCC_158 TaxID=3239220 RepID=UPI00352490B3
MKNHLILMTLSLAAVAGANAQTTAPVLVIFASNPVILQAAPSVLFPALLIWKNAIPLKVSEGGKCLLVARRGPQIVAVELSPLNDGPTVVGWSTREIDMDTATSRWGYVAPKWPSDEARLSNPVTASIGASSKTVAKESATPASFSSSGARSNASVEAHGQAADESEWSETVTVNGKTYRKYSHFKAASTGLFEAVQDEYICQ